MAKIFHKKCPTNVHTKISAIPKSYSLFKPYSMKHITQLTKAPFKKGTTGRNVSMPFLLLEVSLIQVDGYGSVSRFAMSQEKSNPICYTLYQGPPVVCSPLKFTYGALLSSSSVSKRISDQQDGCCIMKSKQGLKREETPFNFFRLYFVFLRTPIKSLRAAQRGESNIIYPHYCDGLI